MDIATEWAQIWLPHWPLATDDPTHGTYRTSRSEAMTKRIVQANPSTLSNLLIVDIDHTDASLRALSASHHPMPNAVVENPANGHAHAVWALAEPVTSTEYARRKPLIYAAAVTEGLRRAVDGDAQYSGLLTKNPAHEAWITHWMHSELRSLDELAHGLDGYMPPPRWRDASKRRGDVAGLGRNCALFETARFWAYREIRCHWGDSAGLAAAIHREAAIRNLEFPEPLPASEVRAIAASIHRWIVTHSDMWRYGPAVYEATFATMQSARGRKGSAKSAEARRNAMRSQLENL